MTERGFSSREIATKIGCGSHATILRLKEKYEETGNVKDKQRPGWPRKLNDLKICQHCHGLKKKNDVMAIFCYTGKGEYLYVKDLHFILFILKKLN